MNAAKRFLKIFTLLLVLAVVGVAVGVFYLMHDNAKDVVKPEQVRAVLDSDQIIANPMSGFSQLTEKEQAAYLRLCRSIEAVEEDYTLTGNPVTTEEFERLTRAILKDHPEYFYVDQFSYTVPYGSDVIENGSIHYTMDPETVAAKRQEIENWKNGVLAGITPDMDNKAAARYLHDYLAANTRYKPGENDQNLLSVVERGETVCAGYTKTYQYLLNQAGIFATQAYGSSQNQSHAWNLVQLDGEYGWVDLTWDDPNFSGEQAPENFVSHTYYGLSSEALKKTHQFDAQEQYYPDVPEPSFNYFKQNDLYFDLDDPGAYKKLTQKIRETYKNGGRTIEIRLADRGQIDTLLEKLSYDDVLPGGDIIYFTDKDYPVIAFELK